MLTRLSAIAALLLAADVHAIEQYQAKEIEPYQAKQVQPYQSREIGQRQAQEIQPRQAREIPMRQAKEIQVNRPNASPESGGGGQAGGDTGGLLGVWATNIPGGVWTSPSGTPGYDILHVSTGAASGLLKINGDHTYSWNSYGGKKGRWEETGRADYPIVLIDTVENRKWLVGFHDDKVINIWSKSIYYKGRRAAVGK